MLNQMCNSLQDGGSILCVQLMRNILEKRDQGVVQEQQMHNILFYTLTTLQRALTRKTESSGNGNRIVDSNCMVPHHCRVELREAIYCFILRATTTGGSELALTPEQSKLPSFLRTKIGVVLSLLIQVDFPDRWPAAFEELIQIQAHPPNQYHISSINKSFLEILRNDIFLRLLDGFCDEVVENTSIERNTMIKDYMRGIACSFGEYVPVGKSIAARILQAVMTTFQSTIRYAYESSAIIQNATGGRELQKLPIMCLCVLKRFIPWLDLSLALNENIVTSLVMCIRHAGPGDDDADGSPASQCATEAICCLKEITGKGMEDEKRIQVILNLNLFQTIIDCGVNLEIVDMTHINVIIKVAELVAECGEAIISFWENSMLSTGNQTQLNLEEIEVLTSQLNLMLVLCFRCFAYDDIDVSGAIIPLVARLMTTLNIELKLNIQGSSIHDRQLFKVSQYLPQLLSIMYEQMKYPSDFEFDYEDEDDAEEEIYRSELRKLNQSVIRICPDVALQYLGNSLSQIQAPLSSATTNEIEAALRLLFHYSEGIRPSPGIKQVLKNQMFRDVLVALHSSDITAHPHREVLILYYDISVRYADLLKDHIELLPNLLESISGPRGLQHEHPRVRSRTSYQMLKLVKALGVKLRPFVETAVEGIQGLLSNLILSLHPDDTLYLFETIGLLLGRTGLDEAEQQRYLIIVITPHMKQIEDLLLSPEIHRDPETVGQTLAYSIASLAYLTKGFTKKISPAIQLILCDTVPRCVSVLQTLCSVDLVRNKVMIYLQRLILCLGETVLPMMPTFIELLIKHCSQEDILDVAQILNQLCFKFKAMSVPIFETSILPFLKKCHELMPSDDGKGDDPQSHIIIEQLHVKKIIYSTMNQLVSSGCAPALLSPSNVTSLRSILTIVGDGAISVQDPTMKKSSIQFFKALTDQWMVSGARSGIDNVALHTYQSYLLEIFLPGALNCFLGASFDEEDAMQYRSIREVAAIFSSLSTNRPDIQLDKCVALALAQQKQSIGGLSSLQGLNTQKDVEVFIKNLLRTIKS